MKKQTAERSRLMTGLTRYFASLPQKTRDRIARHASAGRDHKAMTLYMSACSESEVYRADHGGKEMPSGAAVMFVRYLHSVGSDIDRIMVEVDRESRLLKTFADAPIMDRVRVFHRIRSRHMSRAVEAFYEIAPCSQRQAVEACRYIRQIMPRRTEMEVQS